MPLPCLLSDIHLQLGHYRSNSLSDRNDESHIGQYCFHELVNYRLGLSEAVHLGLRYCRGRTIAGHVAQRLLNNVGHSEFEASIRVVSRLYRLFEYRLDTLDDLDCSVLVRVVK